MNDDTKILLDIYKDEFKNYKTFLDNNQWTDDIIYNSKSNKLESNKLNTEISIIDTIVKSTDKFKSDIGEDINKKPVKDFIKTVVTIINNHIKGIEQYKKTHPLTEDSLEHDVKFHSDLFALIAKTKVNLSKLKIDENELAKKSVDLFYGNGKAPLLMREFLSETFPIIKDKTNLLDIDFSAVHINPETSNEMFINMKPRDIPKWDETKHFFEQEKSTIQFWEEEFKKIKNGVNLNGYYLSPWLYWHINHFKLSYIDEFGTKGIFQPQLRDNEYYFDQMYRKAKEHGRCGLLLYGTRRFSKSVVMSSKIMHDLYTIYKCQATIQGFSLVPDLKAIIDYISDAVENMTPALKIPANSMDLNEGAVLGLKGKKAQDRYDLSRLTVVNLESGTTNKGGQKTAGSTPDSFVADEIAKGPIITSWNAAIPSFAGGHKGKWRVTPLLSATSGSADLSQDAEKMLKNPETYKIMPMDYDILEEMVDPEYITWNRQQFGMFVPAQMSLEAPPKIIKSMSEFLGVENNPKLDDLRIHTTDWKAAKEFFEAEQKIRSNDIDVLASYKNSFPLDPEDCYITTEQNKFPGLQSKARRKYIEENGETGQRYRLHKDASGTIHAEMTNDPIIEDYPFKGGSFDAPVVMLENPLLGEEPPLGLYVLGFDDVRQSGKTDGDSVISATIYKRGYEGGEWADRYVAWYDSRPDRKQDYYKTLYLLVKIFNARILAENEDNGFLEWMETHHMDDVYIHFSTGVGLASEENLNLNKNRKFGWSPTALNIYRLEQKLVMYTKEDGIVINGIEDLTGVDRINHPMLLEEFYKYKKGKNADRIRSAGLALTLAQYYDKTYQYMKKRRRAPQEEDTKKKKTWNTTFTDTKRLNKW